MRACTAFQTAQMIGRLAVLLADSLAVLKSKPCKHVNHLIAQGRTVERYTADLGMQYLSPDQVLLSTYC